MPPRRTATLPSLTNSSRLSAKAGFFGLRASPEYGGAGEGLLTTAVVVETLAKSCPSTALIYKMHLESSEIVSRVPTPQQAADIAPRVASGEWLSTVAGSEAGHQGGAWAGAPKAAVRVVEGGVQVEGVKKAFVTAAGIAETYLFMATLREEGKRQPRSCSDHQGRPGLDIDGRGTARDARENGRVRR